MTKKRSKTKSNQPPSNNPSVFTITRGSRPAGTPIPRPADPRSSANIVTGHADNNTQDEQIIFEDQDPGSADHLFSPVDETVQDLRTIFEASQASTTLTTVDNFDSDMITLLTTVIYILLNNEVAIALLELGYLKWKTFRKMLLQDIDELKKDDERNGRVPTMLAHRRTIERFFKFIDYKIQQNDPNSPPDDAASYSADDFEAFTDDITAHVFGASSPLSNTTDEKALEAWNQSGTVPDEASPISPS